MIEETTPIFRYKPIVSHETFSDKRRENARNFVVKQPRNAMFKQKNDSTPSRSDIPDDHWANKFHGIPGAQPVCCNGRAKKAL